MNKTLNKIHILPFPASNPHLNKVIFTYYSKRSKITKPHYIILTQNDPLWGLHLSESHLSSASNTSHPGKHRNPFLKSTPKPGPNNEEFCSHPHCTLLHGGTCQDWVWTLGQPLQQWGQHHQRWSISLPVRHEMYLDHSWGWINEPAPRR